MYIGSNEHKINARNALAKARSVNDIKIQCSFCDHTTNKANIKKHEKHCHLNPTNRKECPVCSKPIKDYKKSTTCSLNWCTLEVTLPPCAGFNRVPYFSAKGATKASRRQ